jgi:dCTP deaminase
MIISDQTLKRMLAERQIVVEPVEPYQLQPASIDLRLGRRFLKLDENALDALSLDTEPCYVTLDKEEIVLPPQTFLLATTVEYVKIPANVTAFVEGRSSIGRMGLFIQNAGWVDPGFEGTITLELFNANRLPLRLTAGRRICQIVFALMDRESGRPYEHRRQPRVPGPGASLVPPAAHLRTDPRHTIVSPVGHASSPAHEGEPPLDRGDLRARLAAGLHALPDFAAAVHGAVPAGQARPREVHRPVHRR